MMAFSDCLWRGFLILMYYELLTKSWFPKLVTRIPVSTRNFTVFIITIYFPFCAENSITELECRIGDSGPGGKIDFRTRSMKPTWIIVIMQIAPPHPSLVTMGSKSLCYSSNKIRKTQMSTWTSFVKIWTVSNCELDANFLTFLSLYHLLFAIKTTG